MKNVLEATEGYTMKNRYEQVFKETNHFSSKYLYSLLHQNVCLGKAFSSPEPLGSQGELTVYPCSGVRCRRRRRRRPQCSTIFSSETARPIKAKFHVGKKI